MERSAAKKPLLMIEQILNKEQMYLYKRHIEDGMDFDSLSFEFNCAGSALKQRFGKIEDTLREAFKRA